MLQIHDRDAHAEVMEVLERDGAPERTVMHCFSGDASLARLCVDRGYYLSFAGTVTFKNASELRGCSRRDAPLAGPRGDGRPVPHAPSAPGSA